MPTSQQTEALAKQTEKLFEEFMEQAAAHALPTTRREESLATLKRLEVVTEAEANTIAKILAKGDGSARGDLDVDRLVHDIEAARDGTSSPVTRAILYYILVAAKKRRQSATQTPGARLLVLSKEEWADVGDAIVLGAAGGATAGAAVGAAGTAGFGAMAGAIGGALIGGVIGGAVKAHTIGK
jgi:hypothetical protein